MQKKKRKLKKEELELWKLVTRKDKVIGKYTKSVEENKEHLRPSIISDIDKGNKKIEKKENNFLKQDIQINKRMKIKLERGLIRPETKLDLHGKTLVEAKEFITNSIMSCVENNIRCILIITGKKKTLNGSKGLIRENLPLWLKEAELSHYILHHCFATKKDGDDGARYILLRKKDKVLYG